MASPHGMADFAAAVALAILVFGAHLNPLFWGAFVKPIAAIRLFEELPALEPVPARKVTLLGSTGSIGVNTLRCDRPCPQSVWRRRISDRRDDGRGQCPIADRTGEGLEAQARGDR